MPLTRLQRSTQEKATPEVTSQPTIKAFVKVQKRQDAGTNTSEQHKETQSLAKPATVLGKRSRSESIGQCEQERHAPSAATAYTKAPSYMPQTPQKSAKYRSYLPSPTPTPSKDRVRSLTSLDDPQLVGPLSLKEQRHYETPPATPSKSSSTLIAAKKEGKTTLPKELCDLIDLFTSFLKALTLHVAHHGTIAAVDVQELLQSTSKIWRLRSVNLNDLRRCLGPLCSPSQDSRWEDVRKLNLQLVRYDRNRICIELGEADYDTRCSRLFDHEKWAQIFQENLQKRWESWISLDDNEQVHDAEKFVQQLPLAALPRPVRNMNPAILKGQQRLEDLKSTVEKAHKEVGESTQARRACKLNNKSRSQGLLERLKNKEIQNAALPSAPNKSDLERKTSIARLPEIVRILSFGQRAGQRSTQSLSSLIDQIRNSARTPLSRADVEKCINILAKEVDCGYVTLLHTGAVVGVVVDHNHTPKDIHAWTGGHLST